MKNLKMLLPENDAELEILTLWYFGKKLHLQKLYCSGDYASYEVKEPYKSYHGKMFKYSEHSCDGYDHSQRFWNVVIGQLTCGGIAGNSYGQVKVTGYRNQKRLKKWMDNRRSGQSGRLRPAFMRLARKIGAGENNGTHDTVVLINDRVDGALGALINQEVKQ